MARWVVVGGGAAGCVVAATLSARADAEVVLLEAGPDHGTGSVPDDVGPYLDDPGRVRVETVRRSDGREPEPYVQGLGLGGSSLINGAIVTRVRDRVDAVPVEAPWALGSVGRALLATDPVAAPVGLVRHERRRRTAADTFLRPVLDRRNLTVRCDVPVAGLVFAGRRAVGVRLGDGGVVDADRVVLCAGAIRTPTLLLRSGVDTPGVGSGVQDHPTITFTLRLVDSAVDATDPAIAVVATHAHHQLVAINHLPGSTTYGAVVVGLLDVRSVGRISIDAVGEPVVELRQLSDPLDRRLLADAVVETRHLLDAPAWREIAAAVFVDDAGTPMASLDDADLVDWVVGHAGGHHHVAASCREGVVTDGGVVRGYEGLYVADASTFPGVPRIDPYRAVVARARGLAATW
jgi:choline dehydrogenase-like flavoprotein